MNKRKIVKTNLEDATSEQREKFMQNLIEAHKILHKSVVGRYYKSFLDSLK